VIKRFRFDPQIGWWALVFYLQYLSDFRPAFCAIFRKLAGQFVRHPAPSRPSTDVPLLREPKNHDDKAQASSLLPWGKVH